MVDMMYKEGESPGDSLLPSLALPACSHLPEESPAQLSQTVRQED